MGACLLAAGAPQPCAAPQALPGSPRGRRGGTRGRGGTARRSPAVRVSRLRPPPAARRSQREIKPRAGGEHDDVAGPGLAGAAGRREVSPGCPEAAGAAARGSACGRWGHLAGSGRGRSVGEARVPRGGEGRSGMRSGAGGVKSCLSSVF